MSDALSSNQPTVCDVATSLCNSHAKRQFIDVINHFPDEVEHILKLYGEIWVNDHKTSDDQLSKEKILEYHQAHSLPILEEINL